MNKECIRVVNCTWHDAVREGLIKLLLSSSRISARMNDLIHSTVDSRRLIIIVRSKLGEPIFSKIKPVWEIFVKNLLLRLQWRIEFHHATLPQEISVRPLSFTRDFNDLFLVKTPFLKHPFVRHQRSDCLFLVKTPFLKDPFLRHQRILCQHFLLRPCKGLLFLPPLFPATAGAAGL